jgi:hypothetical protein
MIVLANFVERLADKVLTSFGEADDPGASVGGVGLPFEVPGAFERVDEFAH